MNTVKVLVTGATGQAASHTVQLLRDAMNYQGWITKAAKQPMALQTVDLGPLGADDVEVAVEHCGLCHSDLSVLNNECGIPLSRPPLGPAQRRPDRTGAHFFF